MKSHPPRLVSIILLHLGINQTIEVVWYAQNSSERQWEGKEPTILAVMEKVHSSVYSNMLLFRHLFPAWGFLFILCFSSAQTEEKWDVATTLTTLWSQCQWQLPLEWRSLSTKRLLYQGISRTGNIEPLSWGNRRKRCHLGTVRAVPCNKMTEGNHS